MNQTQHQSAQLEGTPLDRVTRAVKQLRNGGGILVTDDENRENEGDLIFAAETITEQQMALMIRECSGIVCLPLSGDIIEKLDLPQMTTKNSSSMGTAFTVSIEAKEGVTTGVSATDRVTTIRTAINPQTKPEDLARPGHVFPLRAHSGGVLARAGHTEASVELAKMAGFKEAAVLCELTNEDGTMSRMPEIQKFAQLHNMPIVTVEDIQHVVNRSNDAAA